MAYPIPSISPAFAQRLAFHVHQMERRRRRVIRRLTQAVIDNNQAAVDGYLGTLKRYPEYAGLARRVRAARLSIRAYKHGHYELSGELAQYVAA